MKCVCLSATLWCNRREKVQPSTFGSYSEELFELFIVQSSLSREKQEERMQDIMPLAEKIDFDFSVEC